MCQFYVKRLPIFTREGIKWLGEMDSPLCGVDTLVKMRTAAQNSMIPGRWSRSLGPTGGLQNRSVNVTWCSRARSAAHWLATGNLDAADKSDKSDMSAYVRIIWISSGPPEELIRNQGNLSDILIRVGYPQRISIVILRISNLSIPILTYPRSGLLILFQLMI